MQAQPNPGVLAFVSEHLPPTPARVLEVGCGSGDLARALAADGYDVTAIDPEAPEGPDFRRLTLEELTDPGPFDAVVAVRTLHHVDDLPTSVGKLSGLLVPAGALIVEDYAKERLDDRTARWYFHRRLDRAAAGGDPAPGSLADCIREWEHDDAHIHSYGAMRTALDARFRERFFRWVPYLYRELGEAAPEDVEQAAIDDGSIEATGFRYVGQTARP